MKKLGENQITALESLIKHGSYPGGWHLGSDSATVRVLESLERRALVDTFRPDAPRKATQYTINNAGRMALLDYKEAIRLEGERARLKAILQG